jgi:hypothetical protein
MPYLLPWEDVASIIRSWSKNLPKNSKLRDERGRWTDVLLKTLDDCIISFLRREGKRVYDPSCKQRGEYYYIYHRKLREGSSELTKLVGLETREYVLDYVVLKESFDGVPPDPGYDKISTLHNTIRTHQVELGIEIEISEIGYNGIIPEFYKLLDFGAKQKNTCVRPASEG